MGAHWGDAGRVLTLRPCSSSHRITPQPAAQAASISARRATSTGENRGRCCTVPSLLVGNLHNLLPARRTLPRQAAEGEASRCRGPVHAKVCSR